MTLSTGQVDPVIVTLEKMLSLASELQRLLVFNGKTVEVDVTVFMGECEGFVAGKNTSNTLPPTTRPLARLLAQKLHSELTKEALDSLVPQRIADIKSELASLLSTLVSELSAVTAVDSPVVVVKYHVGLSNLLEDAWRIIANAGEGNWSTETADWQVAAHAFRKRYHDLLGPIKRQADPNAKELPEVAPSVVYVDSGEVVDVGEAVANPIKPKVDAVIEAARAVAKGQQPGTLGWKDWSDAKDQLRKAIKDLDKATEA